MPIILRNIVFFFLWFMWSGSFNIMPQVFFLTYHPENRIFLVMILLLLGSIFSIAGVWSSHGTWFLNRALLKRQKYGLAFLFAASAASFLMLFMTKDLVIYFLSFMSFRYLSGFLYNHLDQFYVSGLEEPGVALHVRSNILYQLSGMIAAPLYFSFFYGLLPLHILITSILLLISLALAIGRLRSHSMRPIRIELLGGRLFSARDKVFVAYSLLIFCFITLFSAIALYVLRDYYSLENATRLGGILIGATIFVAFLAILVRSLFAERSRMGGVICSTLALYLGGIVVIYLRFSSSISYLLLFSLMAGIGSGIYLVSGRLYASKAKVDRGQSHLLTIFNDMPDLANLAVFGVLSPLSFLMGADPFRFFQFLFIGLFVVFSLALFLALFYAPRVFGGNPAEEA